MSIKSDKWIRRMAESHGMIEPFEPEWDKDRGGKYQGQTGVTLPKI